MSHWSVRLVLASAAPPTEDQTEYLYTKLAEFDPAVGQDERGNIDLNLAVAANTLAEAIDSATDASEKAARDAGVADISVIEVEAMTWEEFERRLEMPPVPELWSVSEAAQYLGVSNQRINQLAAAYPEALPAVVKLAGERGPRIWLADTWRRFADNERRTGRPRLTGNVKASAASI